MNKGVIRFRAGIKGNGLKFSSFDFNVREPGIEKIEMESQNGNEILGAVYISSVATNEEAISIAAEIITTVLDRLSFIHNLAIGTSSITSTVLTPISTQPGELVQIHTKDTLILGRNVTAIASISSTRIKGQLEREIYLGEMWFGLFRLALQSEGHVEKYMSLYQILLVLFNDKQQRVDEFIRNQDPMVPQSPRPDKPEIIETIYSKLRNEFAHRRRGVNIKDTKFAMAQKWIDLAALTKRAIELHP